MGKPRVIFIHGNGHASGNDHWFPWAKRELEAAGVEALTPDFPQPELAPMKVWLPYLENELKADENTVLVGHSSGTVAAMRFAETHKILGSVLVAAYYTDLGYEEEKRSGYFDAPWSWEVIRQNQQWIIQYASLDDPWIPIAEARHVQKMLGTEYHEYTHEGHFGSNQGERLEFSELIEALKEKLSGSR